MAFVVEGATRFNRREDVYVRSLVSEAEKQAFLDSMRLTHEQCEAIVHVPQRTPPWFAARKDRVTGSVVADAAGVGYNNEDVLCMKMLWNPQETDPAALQRMNYGTVQEDYVRTEVLIFMLKTVPPPADLDCFLEPRDCVWIEEEGLIIDPDGGAWSATSSDGVVRLYGRQYLLELKARQINQFYSEAVKEGARTALPAYHYAQIQCGKYNQRRRQRWLAAARAHAGGAGRRHDGGPCACPSHPDDFCKTFYGVSTPRNLEIQEFALDEAYAEDLLRKARDFWVNMYVPRRILQARGVIRTGAINPDAALPVATLALDVTPIYRALQARRERAPGSGAAAHLRAALGAGGRDDDADTAARAGWPARDVFLAHLRS